MKILVFYELIGQKATLWAEFWGYGVSSDDINVLQKLRLYFAENTWDCQHHNLKNL